MAGGVLLPLSADLLGSCWSSVTHFRVSGRRPMETIWCGIDGASDHHDGVLIDPEGRKRGRRRVSHDAAGLGELTAMFAAHGGGPGTVKIAIETERGLLVAALRAAGYEIYPGQPQGGRPLPGPSSPGQGQARRGGCAGAGAHL